MHRHDPSTVVQIKADRLSGLSIHQLMDKYALPKTTIWYHIHTLRLPDVLKKAIRSRQGGSRIKKERDLEQARKQSIQLLENKSEKDIWAALFVALYWSEGNKGAFVFTNTDEDMMRVFVKILKKYFCVPSINLDVLVRISGTINAKTSQNHWAKVIGVPLSQVHVNQDHKNNRTRAKYGICRIRLKKGSYHLKLVQQMKEDVIGLVLNKKCPRSSMDRAPHS